VAEEVSVVLRVRAEVGLEEVEAMGEEVAMAGELEEDEEPEGGEDWAEVVAMCGVKFG
jgi:hypothetical protein